MLDLFHALACGIRSRQGLPINRPRELIVMVKRPDGSVTLVLPEVLKNPIAFFNFNKDEKKASQLQELLLSLYNKPQINNKNVKRAWAAQKIAKNIKIKTMDLYKKKLKDASNRLIKRTALSTKYNFGYFGDLLMVMLNFQTK